MSKSQSSDYEEINPASVTVSYEHGDEGVVTLNLLRAHVEGHATAALVARHAVFYGTRADGTRVMLERDDALRLTRIVESRKPFPPPRIESVAERLRHREEKRAAGQAPPRWLIEGLWPWGTFPQMVGNKAAGKSTCAVQLAFDLAEPSMNRFLFLDRFPVSIKRGVNVMLIATEGNVDLLLDEVMLHLGLADGYTTKWGNRSLTIVHAADIGGPAALDLSEAERRQEMRDDVLWMSSPSREDYDDESYYRAALMGRTRPDVVILDNLTSILQATGRSLTGYGELHRWFQDTLEGVGIPSGMTVTHAAAGGKHPLGGGEGHFSSDGTWSYWMHDPDNPFSSRKFQFAPRGVGGQPVAETQVHRHWVLRHADRRLAPAPILTLDPAPPAWAHAVVDGPGGQVIDKKRAAPAAAAAASSVTEPPAQTQTPEQADTAATADLVVEVVTDQPGIDGQAITDAVMPTGGVERRGVIKRVALAAREAAERDGRIRPEKCDSSCALCNAAGKKFQGRHNRQHWYPRVAVPADEPDDDGESGSVTIDLTDLSEEEI